ncbi:serine hydrolase FSH [Cyathus striatus]|nr:serine hydrolase FSH [Cyathus striatus]
MSTAKKVVLVLHGYSQNAAIFSKRLGALRKEAKDIEMVFIDAPIILQPADLVFATPGNVASQLDSSEATPATQDPALAPRGWWKANQDKTEFYGMEESISMIRDVLKERKFDGVLGFSQGAAFAALISALLERPDFYPSFLVDGKPPHPPFQFCIAAAGFLPRDKNWVPLFSTPYSTPTLHIIGKTDVVVTQERARTLVDASANARVVEHEGGHFVPSKGNWRKFIANYMRDHTTTNPAPPLVGSVPASGTATPVEGSEEVATKLQYTI